MIWVFTVHTHTVVMLACVSDRKLLELQPASRWQTHRVLTLDHKQLAGTHDCAGIHSIHLVSVRWPHSHCQVCSNDAVSVQVQTSDRSVWFIQVKYRSRTQSPSCRYNADQQEVYSMSWCRCELFWGQHQCHVEMIHVWVVSVRLIVLHSVCKNHRHTELLFQRDLWVASVCCSIISSPWIKRRKWTTWC